MRESVHQRLRFHQRRKERVAEEKETPGVESVLSSFSCCEGGGVVFSEGDVEAIISLPLESLFEPV